MLWPIKSKLRGLSKRAEPGSKFRVALRKELVSRLPRRPWYALIMRPVAVTASLAAMLGAGTASYAYASDSVLPDHPLYPVREQVENLVKTVAVTPKLQAAARLKLVLRRVRETEVMAARQRPLERPQVEKFEREFSQAVTAGGELNNGERAEFDGKLSAAELAQIKILQGVRERMRDEKGRQEVEDIIQDETRKITEKIDQLREKRKDQFEQQLKRREAIQEQLPWKVEGQDVRILPVETEDTDVEAQSVAVTETASNTRPVSKDRRVMRIEPKPRPMPPANQEPVRARPRRLIERGGLRVLRREDGGIQLVSTTSTPAGIKLLLKDINQRLMREPGLITEKDGDSIQSPNRKQFRFLVPIEWNSEPGTCYKLGIFCNALRPAYADLRRVKGIERQQILIVD